MALRIATAHAAAQCGSQTGRRDRNGAPIEIDPRPGDPAPTPADVETMSQRLDMLDELTAQKHMTPAAFDRRVEILNETVGEGGALGQAFEAVAEQGRAKLCGEDDPSHDLAVAKAHALARDAGIPGAPHPDVGPASPTISATPPAICWKDGPPRGTSWSPPAWRSRPLVRRMGGVGRLALRFLSKGATKVVAGATGLGPRGADWGASR